MDPYHLEVIANDDREVHAPARRLAVRSKLAWYALSRPVLSTMLRRRLLVLAPELAQDPVFARVDMFLNGEGGMFKEYAYRLCERTRPLRGSSVLVPGIGYAKNLLQLAAFRPKEIVAFDLYEYPEVWRVMAEKIRKEFGVPVVFYKGDFNAVPAKRKGTFDFVVSDAVLEHVPDMGAFAAASREYLRPGGIFYASFGPLWYGPSGDHTDWGSEKLFDHILLSREDYERQLRERPLAIADRDSCDSGFMIQEDFFSHLRAKEYLDHMEANSFRILELRAKVAPGAVRLLRQRPDIRAALDAKGFPAFDRFSGGLYIWAERI